MPIPTPKPNEAEGSFMSRCIRFVIDEGTPQEQAIAICSSQYRKEKLKVMTWKTIDRKRASYIKYAKTEFSRALKAQANEYLDKVKQSGISSEYSISRAPMENAMFNVYSRVMKQFAKDTYSQFAQKALKTEINWDEWVARWFEGNTTDLIGGIDTYTQNGIRSVAERAIVEGWGIREFQNNLFDLYQISERRAELIGRTEIIRASNAGSLMGAQETGFPMQKFWLATRDNRTRGLNPKDIFDHYSMDEDKGIPLDQAFNVSGEQLQHPGDRAGSPGNTINCRCTMTYQVLEEGVDEVSFSDSDIETYVNRDNRKEAIEWMESNGIKYSEESSASISQLNAVNRALSKIKAKGVNIRDLDFNEIRFTKSFKSAGSVKGRTVEFSLDLFDDEIIARFSGPVDDVARMKKRLNHAKIKLNEIQESPEFYTNDYLIEISNRISRLEDSIKNAKTIPFSRITTSMEDVAMHEFGHVIDDFIRMNGDKINLPEWTSYTPQERLGLISSPEEWRNTPASQVGIWAKTYGRKIGDYATTNDLELMAESWVAFMKGQNELIHPEILKAFKTLINQ